MLVLSGSFCLLDYLLAVLVGGSAELPETNLAPPPAPEKNPKQSLG